MTSPIRTFRAPGEYIQGPGALDLVGAKCAALGRAATIVIDAGIIDDFAPRIAESLQAAKMEGAIFPFEGEPTFAALDALAEAARAEGADVMVGVGGGRAIDAAKGAALRLGTPVITCPTIAATDAAAAKGIVVYNDRHEAKKVERLARNPDCILADTLVIAGAPVEFLRSGIGEVLSKAVEAEACFAVSGLTSQDTPPMHTARGIAHAAHWTVRDCGVAALEACRRNEVTDDLEAVVEATLLLSAIAFENGGLSLAHGIATALGADPDARGTLHGDHVAYGALVQLRSEAADEAIIGEFHAFMGRVGLARRLSEIGIEGMDKREFEAIAEAALAIPFTRNTPAKLDVATLASAISEVEIQPANR